MKIVGITGGVGCGKSEVIRYLEKKEHTQVILADEVGHLVMKKGQMCFQAVLDLFGPSIIGADGELSRPSIAAIVYQDKDKLLQLNAIIHPAVRVYIERAIEEAKSNGIQYFFIEAALLLEEEYDKICDEVWYIFAEREVRKERLKKSRNYSDEKIDQMIANQLSEEEFSERCDVTIQNSGDFENTKEQIESRMSLL